ncbi:MAG: cupin domain-containing protein [Chloroflexi bacterium]|nr:cupin domain-containing protein [Chloroflexota bacterium]
MVTEQTVGGRETGCVVIRAGQGQTYAGKQQLSYFEGISAQNAGSKAICMHLLTIPPGARARTHLHQDHETTVYVLSGEAEMLYGEGLRERLVVRSGEFLYIPAGVPHVPINLSQTEPCTAILARTDPNEQESVVLLPELEDVAK